MTEAKKYVKNALSEVDFRNTVGAIGWLYKAASTCAKY